MAIYIYRGSRASVSAVELARNINARCNIEERCKINKRNHTRMRAGSGDVLINWGVKTVGSVDNRLRDQSPPAVLLNKPTSVAIAGHKRLALARMAAHGVPTVQFTTNPDQARDWVDEDGHVVERHELCAHSGAGIRIPESTEDVDEECPLFTRYFRGRDEFRVHVMRRAGRGDMAIIGMQRKARRTDLPNAEGSSFWIRSYENGFVYTRQDVELPAAVERASRDAVAALGLDFGAVDIRYNARRDACAVLEVNTAPGLTGTTLAEYADALLAIYREGAATA